MIDLHDAYKRGFLHGLVTDYNRAHEIGVEYVASAVRADERRKVLEELDKLSHKRREAFFAYRAQLRREDSP